MRRLNSAGNNHAVIGKSASLAPEKNPEGQVAQPYSQTYVKSDGAGNCSCLANRCAFLDVGVANASDGGTVNVLDANAQGPFGIDKGLSILALSGQNMVEEAAIAYSSGFAGIVINTTSAKIVTISGVGVDYHGYPYDGIVFVGSGALHLSNCIFRGASTAYGIKIVPTGPSEIYISDCVIAGNGEGSPGGGILIKPSGSGSAKVVLDNVRMENNRVGILLDGAASSGGIDMNVSASTISGSTTIGIGVFEAVSGGSPSKVQVARTTISSNGGQGIFASRSLATVRLRQSEITGNTVGVQTQNGGQIISHGDNLLADNTTNGAFTSTLPPQ